MGVVSTLLSIYLMARYIVELDNSGPDGRISACVFTSPAVEADDTYYFDYALLYVAALEEYLQETNDAEALNDLYDVAMQQIELALQQCGPDFIVTDQVSENTFIDWCEGLDKTACAQAVLIYTLRYAHRLAQRKNDCSQADWLMKQQEYLQKAALDKFWDSKKLLYFSGSDFLCQSDLDGTCRRTGAKDRSRIDVLCTGVQRLPNDYTVYAPLLPDGVAAFRYEGYGAGTHEIILGWHDFGRYRYILGALESSEPGIIPLRRQRYK